MFGVPLMHAAVRMETKSAGTVISSVRRRAGEGRRQNQGVTRNYEQIYHHTERQGPPAQVVCAGRDGQDAGPAFDAGCVDPGGQEQCAIYALHRRGRPRDRGELRKDCADRHEGGEEAVSPLYGFSRWAARRVVREVAGAAAGGDRGTVDQGHAAEVEDGPADGDQAEGLQGTASSAPGAAASGA